MTDWQPGDPLHPVVDGVTRPMFEEIPDRPAITLEICDALLHQIEMDRGVHYWQSESHAETLDHAKVWIESLHDWLEAGDRT